MIYLTRFPNYVTWFCYFRFFLLKFPSYEKLAMTSQLDLTRFYDVIIRNSVFQLGFLLGNSRSPFGIFLTSKMVLNPSKVQRKRCSENMIQIYKWTPVPKRDFNEVALKKLKWYGWSVKQTITLQKNFSERLFLRTPLDGCFFILNITNNNQ